MGHFTPGYTVLSLADTTRDGPILVDLWYPADRGVAKLPYDYKPGFGQVASLDSHAIGLP